MRTVLSFVAVAGLLAFSACDSKETQETASPATLEDATNATDIAETTAAPIDTAGVLSDSVSTDSIQ
ncbi:hypothetical protein [Sabulibacter ruber]|uniref:hypothetical protein n=1 Tax=Sabulibacter ruber TaxID=2811901 RepID=UPI001A95BC92|nr:hypothetical protein [Sabulibacter ruber]